EGSPPTPMPKTHEENVGASLWGCSTAQSPIDPDLFEGAIREVTGTRDRTPGLTGNLAELRFRFMS
ncbi:unnamed protein product, partial [Prorocentrum cordatum]